MKKPVFTGTCTALVTPFLGSSVNHEVLFSLLDRQIAANVDAVVLCGTTGEASTMSDEEQIEVIRRGSSYVAGRMTVIAGTGSNCTAHAVLVVTPYYNKATPKGLILHYTAIADAVGIPVIAYNVPSRTGVDIPLSVYEALSRHPNINGVKDASGNLGRISHAIGQLGEDFHVWSGNDDQNVPILALGGKGVISVLSNVCPAKVVQLVNACLKGNVQIGGALQNKLMPLIEALFCEVNPIPVKAAMERLGFQVGLPRLPLCPMIPEHLELLERRMETLQ